ncbi:hypothetical protein EfsSVR2332_23620 [Enterococcus faecalis]|uniref:Uncharacterized protein n=1 Tax=Enterococcus faecalis TaxID=1351 RepID=A0AC59HRM2_ENTFL|nr:hypothetical protein EfsSVR2332_23620 [Enterococcus faecalis]
MDAIEKIISEIKQQGKQEVEAYVTSEQTRIDQEFQAATTRNFAEART